MRELLYLSTKKLGTFLPGRPSLSVQGAGSASLGPVSVTVDVSTASPAGFDETTIKAFRRVVGHLEREGGTSRPRIWRPGSGYFSTSRWGTAQSIATPGPCPRPMM